MAFPLSVLDQSPIVFGATPRQAVAATIELAVRAEELGYRRYWLAEHHSSQGLADASPEVLLARLTAETSRIRLGTGGIMLPHYSAFKVAEAFRMLDALAPGRIDLGVGRAPGGMRIASAALESRDPELFPRQILDAIGYLDGTTDDGSPFAALRAMPSGETTPDVWILGSSNYGALLAAQLGLPYAYAHFIGGDNPGITRAYRSRFRPSPRCPEPRVLIALHAIVAPTDEEAELLSLPGSLQRLRRLRGASGPIPSLEEATAYPWTPLERYEVAQTRRIVTGSPETARGGVEALVEEYGADEAMIVTIAPTYAARTRSYELLAEAFETAARAA
jgi:luciferase family oxidoreductase group 1